MTKVQFIVITLSESNLFILFFNCLYHKLKENHSKTYLNERILKSHRSLEIYLKEKIK